MRPFRIEALRQAVNTTLARVPKPNSNAAAIFRNKIYSSLLKRGDNTRQIIADGRVRSTFKISNCLARDVCCFC